MRNRQPVFVAQVFVLLFYLVIEKFNPGFEIHAVQTPQFIHNVHVAVHQLVAFAFGLHFYFENIEISAGYKSFVLVVVVVQRQRRQR